MQKSGFLIAGALAFGIAAPLAAQDQAVEEPAADTQATDAQTAPAELPVPTLQNVAADTVVATVNDTPITLGQMIIARSQLPPQYQQLPDDVLFDGVLDQLIQQQVLADTLGDDPLRVTVALENERRLLRAGEVVQSIVTDKVTEEAIQAAYDLVYASTDGGTEFNASHILVASLEEANDVLARIANGEDFATIAQELSTDVGSGANGGSLGWFGEGMMVAPFEEAVKTLETGGVSAPVETQFGWHIIKLNDVRQQETPALADVHDEIAAQVREEAIQAALAELSAAATITRPEAGAFDPAVLIDLSLLRGN